MSSIAFVETEMGGKSIRFGQWIERPDGLNAIRFTEADVKKVAGVLK